MLSERQKEPAVSIHRLANRSENYRSENYIRYSRSGRERLFDLRHVPTDLSAARPQRARFWRGRLLAEPDGRENA